MRNEPQLPHKKIGVAAIENDLREVLIARRLPGGAMGGLWEFPGGKIEAGETIEECIVREIREELDVTVEIDRHLITVEHTYDDFSLTLTVYLCRLNPPTSEPRAIAASEIRWVSLAEIDRYNFPAANKEIIKALRNRAEEK